GPWPNCLPFHIYPPNARLPCHGAPKLVIACRDTEAIFVKFAVRKIDDVRMRAMVIDKTDNLVAGHLRRGQPKERLVRVGPVRKALHQAILLKKGLILPAFESAYVRELLRISNNDDRFRAIE